MEIVYQLMMGLSLAACAGFRATLPMLIMAVMARTGHIQLNSSLQFLSGDTALTVLAIASVIEFLGDKIIGFDHVLDVIGTVARPIAGMLLTSAMLTKIDPFTAMALGLVVGGGTAFTMHAGKAVVRAKSTVLAGFHGGLGNAALSVGEDAVSGTGSVLSVFFPIFTFFCAIVMMGAAVGMVILGFYAGKKLLQNAPVQ